MIKNVFGKIYLPLTWFILIQVLLCLPGSSIPDTDKFFVPNFDKVVHISLYGGLVGLWCYYLYLRNLSSHKLVRLFFLVFFLAAFNGILMEYVQRCCIPGRSFDLGDIVADLLGCSFAYGICNIKLLKTKT